MQVFYAIDLFRELGEQLILIVGTRGSVVAAYHKDTPKLPPLFHPYRHPRFKRTRYWNGLAAEELAGRLQRENGWHRGSDWPRKEVVNAFGTAREITST